MSDGENLSKEEEARKKMKELREKYKDFIRLNEPVVSINDIHSYLRKKRLARLILIIVALKKKCFLNEIYELANKKFKIRSYSINYLRCLNKLSLYNLIEIHKLSLCKDKEMENRYKELKIKYPLSKIHYYEFKNNPKNLRILNFWIKNELKPNNQ